MARPALHWMEGRIEWETEDGATYRDLGNAVAVARGITSETGRESVVSRVVWELVDDFDSARPGEGRQWCQAVVCTDRNYRQIAVSADGTQRDLSRGPGQLGGSDVDPWVSIKETA